MSDDLLPMPDDWSRALAVVAHPDDMEFGAAGAVAAWTAAGREVAYVLLTRGEAGMDTMPPEKAGKLREMEQLASAAIVGVKNVEFLSYVDGMIEYGIPLRRDIVAAIRKYQPELVIIFNHHEKWASGKANTPDHRHTGQAVIDAIGDAGNRWLFREQELEPWGGVKWVAVAGSPQPTHAQDITSTLDIAVASLEAHRAYLDALGPAFADVRGPLAGMANANGARFGGKPCLTFELIAR